MEKARVDYIDNAIRSFEKILKLYKNFREKEKSDAKKFARSFNTRAKNGPQMIMDQGIIPYLTFLASKSGEELIKNTYKFISKEEECDISDPDKAGYAAYFNIIIDYLNKLGIIQVGEEPSIIEITKSLLENLHNYRIIEPIIMKYLIEIKKLSNSYFKKEVEEAG